MERGIQKVNHDSRLAEWVQRVEACRKSGQKVNEWCEKQGIPVSTYYSWRRKVFQAVSHQREICFAEVAVAAERPEIAASIQYGELRVEIHTGADEETIRAIIQALC